MVREGGRVFPPGSGWYGERHLPRPTLSASTTSRELTKVGTCRLRQCLLMPVRRSADVEKGRGALVLVQTCAFGYAMVVPAAASPLAIVRKGHCRTDGLVRRGR